MLRRLKFLSLVLCLIFACLGSGRAVAEDPVPLTTVVISEVQTGGLENTADEFVELYNPFDTLLDVTGWQLQYISASGQTVTILANFNGTISPHGYVLVSYQGYMSDEADLAFLKNGASGTLAKTSGSVQLVDASSSVVDWVGWGKATVEPGWPLLPAPDPGYSFKRILPGDPLYGGVLAFTAATLPATPQGGDYVPSLVPDSDDAEDPPADTPPNSINGCAGAIISEVLPNPGGSDAGHEFIELFNSTEQNISLLSCSIQLSGGKTYAFGDMVLAPYAYASLSDSQTGLALPNSAGGTLWLIDSDNTELQTVSYPAALADNESWALIGSTWEATYAPTPGRENISQPTIPCPVGQVRSEDTGRCKSIATTAAATPAPCKQGQERNPLTNRCRSVLAASTTVKPCKPDETRNPLTNRCRKTVAGVSTLTPCKTGYVRNPQTNRCRKLINSNAKLAKVSDVKSVESANTSGWWIAGILTLAALAYAAYEWRHDILIRIRK